jgi:hypothetical protein
MMVLLVREYLNSHFGRHDGTPQIEQHQDAIWPIHLAERIDDLFNGGAKSAVRGTSCHRDGYFALGHLPCQFSYTLCQVSTMGYDY